MKVIDMISALIILVLLIGVSPDAQSQKHLSAPNNGCESKSRRENFVDARAFYEFSMREISLTNSPLIALIDDEDFDKVSLLSWRLANGAARTPGNGVLMHRFILGIAADRRVDHRNHNRLDNRRENIREATPTQNGHNRLKQSRPCSSKYKGVHFGKRVNRWLSQIQIVGVKKWLGSYNTELEAAIAYDLAALKYFGDFAYLNFPA